MTAPSDFSFLVSRFSFLVSRSSFLVSRWRCDRALSRLINTEIAKIRYLARTRIRTLRRRCLHRPVSILNHPRLFFLLSRVLYTLVFYLASPFSA